MKPPKSLSTLLNAQARDTITGYEGMVVGVTEWNNGCVRLTLQAYGLKDGKPFESHCCDIEQTEVIKSGSVPSRHSGGPMPTPQRQASPSR